MKLSMELIVCICALCFCRFGYALNKYNIGQERSCIDHDLCVGGQKVNDQALSKLACGSDIVRSSKQYTFSWDKSANQLVAKSNSKSIKTLAWQKLNDKMKLGFGNKQITKDDLPYINWEIQSSCKSLVSLYRMGPDVITATTIVDIESGKQYFIGGRVLGNPLPKGFEAEDAQSGQLVPIGFVKDCKYLRVYITDGGFETFDFKNQKFVGGAK